MPWAECGERCQPFVRIDARSHGLRGFCCRSSVAFARRTDLPSATTAGDLGVRAKIIACKTVGETLKGLIPSDMPCKMLEFGLHNTPDKLHSELQQAIDETDGDVDVILLGYGMCSKGAVGLESRRFKLIIPKLDDCIGLFLGSREAYGAQLRSTPGTFFLTKGWIECGDDPYTEYLKMAEKYGPEKAMRMEKLVIKHYTRVAFIDTGEPDMDKYREYAQREAAFFGLNYEEIQGSDDLIRKLLGGEWGDEFVVVEPGGVAEPEMFRD
jgi:hypothetical protein